MVQLVRITDDLPEGFGALRAEADAEGHRHLSRLATELAETPGMFTALLAAFDDGVLVGIGGLTPEPEARPGEAWRMRRLYVRQRARRCGVARTIANALLSEALTLTRLVTVHAGNPDAARFWEVLGFERVEGRRWSHQFFAG
ncbi:GNAT family N-acetyltransferase [Phenylobacterium kunshanense]|uniref:GNAT family N-acetyltransferase n=1 Tax=Phenylobacterium kunshanense TaxID=1445034 RepID=A0A328BEN2_9CAUL|nr:GNAT family N-acetyltransferase [Phenylobacterium kunshanense]RAK65563.1 GNAT family N-acetyltransferase [Phenylobacterium kunshanense]